MTDRAEPNAGEHPSEVTLRALALDQLPPTEAERVVEHLDGCSACGERLDTLTRDRHGRLDSLVRQAELSESNGEPAWSAALAAGYEREGRLGAGGMGVVYAARERQPPRRRVAVKLLRDQAEGRARDRFRREFEAGSRLDHPHVVRVLDGRPDDETPYLVLEFVDGVDMHRYVQRHGPLASAAACDCILQAARGLAHAHEAGIIHRDIKPRNLLRSNAGQIKLTDFGLVRNLDQHDGGLTSPSLFLGTADVVAPEQIRDPRAADARADFYSLGCTFYFLLTGRMPFEAASLKDKLVAQSVQEPPSLPDSGPTAVPAAVRQVVQRLMAKEPEQRFRSADELIRALEPLVRPSRRRLWAAAFTLVAGLLLFAGIARNDETPEPVPTQRFRVLILLDEKEFWPPNYLKVRSAFERADFTVTVSTPTGGRAVSAVTEEVPEALVVTETVAIAAVSVTDFDVVFVSGGKLREFHLNSHAGRQARRLLEEAKSQGKVVCTLGSGIAELAALGGVTGHEVAAQERYRKSVERGEGRVRDDVVVVSERLVTAVSAHDAPHLVVAVRRLLR